MDLLLAQVPEVEVVRQQANVSSMIKCLSIRQPYASWIANPQWFRSHGIPIKCIENRDWQTRYRGPLLIHASKQFENDAFGYWLDYLDGLEQCVSANRSAYPAGAIVGIADLVDCVNESDDPWFVGDYGFVLANGRPIDPIPYTGSLRLFDVPRSLVEPAAALAG